MVIKKETSGRVVLLLYPNRSSNWKQIKYLSFFFSLFCLLIAFIWGWLGIWIILPFAGLELMLLFLFMHHNLRGSYRKEVVVMTLHSIKVSSGFNTPQLKWRFNKKGSEMLILEMRHPDDPPCLYLVGEDNRIEIGRYLNYEDKMQLIEEVKAQKICCRFVKSPITVSM